MVGIHQLANATSTASVQRPRPSRRLLRRVLVRGGHSIGQHVLVAGTGCDELIDWLNSLGFDVESLPEAALESATGDSPASPFDLILVNELDQYRGDLLELNSRRVTAELLSRLKPGGDFVVIRDVASTSSSAPKNGAAHDAVCWTRHLACFPGRVEAFEFPVPWFSRHTWHWLLGRGAARAELVVSLKTPAERMTLADWREHARRGPLTGAACCSSAAWPMPHRHRAA